MNLNSQLLKINYFLLLAFPVSLIFSRLISEIIVFSIIISALNNYDFIKQKLKEKWVIFFLMFYIWLCISTIQQVNLENFLKSIFYIRFLFFSLGIILVLNTKKKLYFFLISILITISFIQIDIIIQFFYGKDLFGYLSSNEVRNSGPFGKELIAGGFLAKFFSLCFFTFYLFSQVNKIQFNELISSLYLVVFVCVVILTGERMAVILSILVVFFIFIIEKKIRLKLFSLLIIFTILMSIFIYNNEKYFNRYVKQNLIQIGFQYKGINYSITDSIYFRLWVTGYFNFKEKPIIGNGLKFYYNDCDHSERYFNEVKLTNCSHPHNIYLDILGATGIVGLTFYILFLFCICISSKMRDLMRRDIYYKYIFKGSLLSLLIIIWPLKTSGAFFNNFNSMILYSIIGILLSNFKLHKKN